MIGELAQLGEHLLCKQKGTGSNPGFSNKRTPVKWFSCTWNALGLMFEGDRAKDNRNAVKHKVSFEEATTIFGDPFHSTIDDPAHPLLVLKDMLQLACHIKAG